MHADGNPSLVISAMADYVSGEVKLQEGETDKCAWITAEQAKEYDMLDGIYEELVMTDHKRKGIKFEWKRM